MITHSPSGGPVTGNTRRGERRRHAQTCGCGQEDVHRAQFPGLEGRVRDVRAFVETSLLPRQDGHAPFDDDLVDTALLLVSELASNAVRHTRSGEPGGMLMVEVRRHAHEVTVEVCDQGPREGQPPSRPVVRSLSLETEYGRGMALVDALATHWDVRRHGPGLAVWFTLTASDASPRRA
ncbi:ATP-binding protein [Marinactinospora thermotolerans]|uniref:ATP-binding protein n=1 Tax=Marinactinospora thermotolerans TaxID=531310 RepID=UPI003D9469F9